MGSAELLLLGMVLARTSRAGAAEAFPNAGVSDVGDS